LEELLGGELAEGLVGADGVVDGFPGDELAIEGWDVHGWGLDLVELLGVSSLSPLDGAIELGRAWREDEEVDAPFLAFCFEGGSELAAAVDLERLNAERHSLATVSRKEAAALDVAFK
jgi:hypothetical protein